MITRDVVIAPANNDVVVIERKECRFKVLFSDIRGLKILHYEARCLDEIHVLMTDIVLRNYRMLADTKGMLETDQLYSYCLIVDRMLPEDEITGELYRLEKKYTDNPEIINEAWVTTSVYAV